MKRRILKLLAALDQLAYVLLTLGAGHPDEYRKGVPIFEPRAKL